MKKLNVDKKMIVGFDMDGVILDHSGTKIKIAKGLGFDLKPHHTPFEVLKSILPQIALEELQKLIYSTPRIAMSTPLMRGAKSVLADLSARNVPIFLISRRKMPEVAIETLKKHLLWPKYFNQKNSFFVNHPEDKDKSAVKLGVTHFVDDELVNINAMPNVPNKFLFDQFGLFGDADHYRRIKSWADFKKQEFYKI